MVTTLLKTYKKVVKKTITLCASAVHFRQVLEIAKQLEEMGYDVKLPETAKLMQKNKNFDVAFYKTWVKNKKDYGKKTRLIKGHFQKIVAGDAILVVNLEKNGFPGYIGGNTLMEMALAFYLHKPIFVYQPIADSLPFKEEVYALEPIFLNGDITKLKRIFKYG